MSTHFYRMSTMDRMGCGRPTVDGTDFTVNTGETTCGNCKRSKAFRAAAADHEAMATPARLVTAAPANTPCGWSARSETGTRLTCEGGKDAVHTLTATLPIAVEGTALCGLHSPYDVTEADRQAVSDWRNGPRVIEYATTEEAYDAAMSDDTITDSTVLMVRTEGVIGVLMNAWPVAVTAANGQFHHTINPPASGTDPSWDKAVSLAVALGFPLQFAERPALMDRIRSLGTVAADVEASAPFRTRSKVKSTSRARRFRKGA